MSNLATQFSFWEHGKDQSAWLLYSARYTEEQLSLKQQQIIRILDTIVTFQDDEIEGIVATMQDWENLTENAELLLEELDILNEALAFHEQQPKLVWKWLSNLLSYNSISSNITYPEWCKSEDDKFKFLYGMLGIIMETTIHAHKDGSILNAQQERLLEKLAQDREALIEGEQEFSY